MFNTESLESDWYNDTKPGPEIKTWRQQRHPIEVCEYQMQLGSSISLNMATALDSGRPPPKRKEGNHPWVSPGPTPEPDLSPKPEPIPKPKAQPRPWPWPTPRAKPPPLAKRTPWPVPAMPKLSPQEQAHLNDHKAADELNDIKLSWTGMITKILC